MTGLAAGSAVVASRGDGSSAQEWAQVGQHNGSYRLLADGPQDTSLVLTAQPGNAGLSVGPAHSGALQDWLEAAPARHRFSILVTG